MIVHKKSLIPTVQVSFFIIFAVGSIFGSERTKPRSVTYAPYMSAQQRLQAANKDKTRSARARRVPQAPQRKAQVAPPRSNRTTNVKSPQNKTRVSPAWSNQRKPEPKQIQTQATVTRASLTQPRSTIGAKDRIHSAKGKY